MKCANCNKIRFRMGVFIDAESGEVFKVCDKCKYGTKQQRAAVRKQKALEVKTGDGQEPDKHEVKRLVEEHLVGVAE